MSNGDKAELPCMGISQPEPLLVHQRNPMPWRAAGKLGGENEEVQEMRGVSVNIFNSEGLRRDRMFIELLGGV